MKKIGNIIKFIIGCFFFSVLIGIVLWLWNRNTQGASAIAGFLSEFIVSMGLVTILNLRNAKSLSMYTHRETLITLGIAVVIAIIIGVTQNRIRFPIGFIYGILGNKVFDYPYTQWGRTRKNRYFLLMGVVTLINGGIFTGIVLMP
jgi:hypothetical protein